MRRWKDTENKRSSLFAAALGALLVAGGGSAIGLAASSQEHAPQPTAAQAGSLNPAPARSRPVVAHGASRGSATTRLDTPAPVSTKSTATGPVLPRSLPLSVRIPAIGVDSRLQYVGLNRDGTIQVPPLNGSPSMNEAAWYKYSPTPGQEGPSIIEGHIDSAVAGPSVFFRLGALRPGDHVDVTLEDGTVAVFRVDGVRRYTKAAFPTATVYGNIDYAGLRLITCGGPFDSATHHYLDNTVVFASLSSPGPPPDATPPASTPAGRRAQSHPRSPQPG